MNQSMDIKRQTKKLRKWKEKWIDEQPKTLKSKIWRMMENVNENKWKYKRMNG